MKESVGLPVNCRRVIQIYRGDGGDVVALAGVDLTIGAGEMVALVGPSGSGKSTLISLLAGLMRPSAGRVSIGAFDMGKLSDRDISRLRGTQMGVVVQGAERNLLPYLSCVDNVALAQRRARRVAGTKMPAPQEILALVGLAHSGHLRPGSLAPGARQRAALAVGAATSPGLLLVDEPTSQLDLSGRDEVVDALFKLNEAHGSTIVVVTHDPEVGERIGRAVTIRDGRVGAEGHRGRDFAVVAGDGTIQLSPEALASFPPGTLFSVETGGESVKLEAQSRKNAA